MNDDSDTPVIKALSQDGIPLVAKFFIQEELAKFEADIGLQLKNSGCNGKTLIILFSESWNVYGYGQCKTGRHVNLADKVKNAIKKVVRIIYKTLSAKNQNQSIICDLGSVTKIEGPLKSSYNLPRDLSKSGASKKIDYTLLATTVLEMLGCDVSMKMLAEIHDYVKNVSNTDVKTFLQKLLE